MASTLFGGESRKTSLVERLRKLLRRVKVLNLAVVACVLFSWTAIFGICAGFKELMTLIRW